MKNWKIITIVAVAFVAAALLVSTVAAMGMGSNGGYGGMMGSGYTGSGGMMSGYGYGYGAYTSPQTSTQTGTPNQAVYPFQFGGGCLGIMGYSGYVAPNYSTGTGNPITINTAATIAQNYLTALGNPDLTVTQVQEYTNSFYVLVSEKSTGNGAFELLINKYSGSIYPEMGPNTMWNTKYGMMRGGILSGIFGTPTTTMSVTQTEATSNAQQYLSSYIPGTTTGAVTTFYGYYSIEIVSGTTPYGILSVNGFTGQVWFHNWLGTYMQEITP